MKTKHLLFIFLFSSVSLPALLSGQTGVAPLQWQRTLGGSGSDALTTVLETPDGGVFLGGSSDSDTSPDKTASGKGGLDVWILKLSASGNTLWQKCLGGKGDDGIPFGIRTQDGGFFLASASNSGVGGDKSQPSRGGEDYWAVKLDSAGNLEWERTFGGDTTDRPYTTLQTADGGYLIGGYSWSGASGDKTETCRGWMDYWVLKLDSQGNLEWQKTVGGNQDDFLHTVVQAPDGGYLLAGWSYSDISGERTTALCGTSHYYSDFWLVKLTAQGSLAWQKTLGGDTLDVLESVIATPDGGFLLGGYTNSALSCDLAQAVHGRYDYWIVKTDSQGNPLWQNTIGGTETEFLLSMAAEPDGGYLLGGISYSGQGSDRSEPSRGEGDYWLVKVDSAGNKLWDKAFGGDTLDFLRVAAPTRDGGYIVGGWSYSGQSGDKTEPSRNPFSRDSSDYWVLKIGPTVTGVANSLDGSCSARAYPNPVGRQVTFELSATPPTGTQIRVRDVTGRSVTVLPAEAARTEADCSAWPQGLYVWTVEHNGQVLATGRLAK